MGEEVILIKKKTFFRSTQKYLEHGKNFPVQLTNRWTLQLSSSNSHPF